MGMQPKNKFRLNLFGIDVLCPGFALLATGYEGQAGRVMRRFAKQAGRPG